MHEKHFLAVNYNGQPTTDYDKPYLASIIQVIASPEKHHHKWIRVTGFFKDNRLYISRDDMKYENIVSSLALEYDVRIEIDKQNIKQWNGKYVMIVGQYDMNKHGFNIPYGIGSLVSIKMMKCLS
jgi:hypothetical protein